MTVPYVDNIKLLLIVELVDHEIERLPSKKWQIYEPKYFKNKNLWKKLIISCKN